MSEDAQRGSEFHEPTSEARHSAILEAALDGIVTVDHRGSIVEFNPAAERMFGHSRADALGKPLVGLLIPPEFREAHLRAFNRNLETGATTILGKRVEIRAMRWDGTTFPVELAVARIRAPGNALYTAYIRDLTERYAAEEKLRSAETRFNHLSESGIIGIIVADANGDVLDGNEEFLRIVGFSREELAAGAIRWPAITPPEWHERDEAGLHELQSTGRAEPWQKEYFRRDGTRVPVMVGAADLDGSRFIAFVLDLSQRRLAEEAMARARAEADLAAQSLRAAEEQLRHSQKMEAVGRLAGAVAHDFNNLLSVVTGYSALLLQDLPEGSPIRADVESIFRAGERAGNLTRQLLTFSRQQVVAPRTTDLNDVIVGLREMVCRLLGENMEIFFRLGARTKVHVDPGQMEQVLMNLVVNARDAMPNGGKITIETADVAFDEEYAREHLDMKAGPYVMLAVSDTGTGMEKALQSRIFEPFFTTKEHGKGTGLGLSTVFGIVKQSQGSIWVYSEVGRGTTFKIYLPKAERADDAPSSAPAPPASARGFETILIVEDDAAVRSVACAALRKNGYTVVEASNGAEAVSLCETYAGEIHLLLTDVIMPGMSGRELAERLVTTRSTMRVLFMSGYTDDAVLHHGVLTAEMSFLQKPLVPDRLLKKVREALE